MGTIWATLRLPKESTAMLKVGDGISFPLPKGATVLRCGIDPRDLSYFVTYYYDDPSTPSSTISFSVAVEQELL